MSSGALVVYLVGIGSLAGSAQGSQVAQMLPLARTVWVIRVQAAAQLLMEGWIHSDGAVLQGLQAVCQLQHHLPKCPHVQGRYDRVRARLNSLLGNLWGLYTTRNPADIQGRMFIHVLLLMCCCSFCSCAW